MNILIVNAFGKSPSAKAKFNTFCNHIREIFKRVSVKSGIDNFFYTLRDVSELDDFTYDAEFNPNEGTKSDLSGKKNFDKMDFIFVDGIERYLPWLEEGYKLSLFLKLCKLSNKVLFAGGVAMQVLIYFLATGYKSDFNFINSKGELQSVEELSSIPQSFLDDLKKNDDFLDYVTGDVMEYNYRHKLWNPILNIGLHKQIIAEKYMPRGKFVLPTSFKKTGISHTIAGTQPIVSNCKEIKIALQKQYLSHWLLKKLPLEFVGYSTLTWFPHYFNVSFKKYQYKTLCESARGPLVIEHENSIGVAFHAQSSYKDTMVLLENFIREKFNAIQDMFYQTKTNYNRAEEPEVPNMFKYFKLNDEIRAGRNVELDDINNIYRPFSTISRVNKSRPFSKVLKVNKEANHVGFSINNRDMVFVVNNSINQRPTSTVKPKLFKVIGKTVHKVDENDNEIDEDYKNSMIQKLKLTPNENSRISELFQIGTEKEINEKINEYNEVPKIDKLQEELKTTEQNIEDYVTFIDKEKMDEDQMICYYKKVRRDICKKLQEIKHASEFRINKLDRLRNITGITDHPHSRTATSFHNKRALTATNFGNTQSTFHFNNETVNGNMTVKDTPKHNQHESVFSLLFPYVNETEFPKTAEKHIQDADINRKGKQIIKIDQQKKTGNNYNRLFKKYEKELKTMGDKPTMNCASDYLSLEERERKEFLESKKKWMSNNDFYRVFGVKTTSIPVIPNIMGIGDSVFAHKFRDIDHTKWINKRDFKV